MILERASEVCLYGKGEKKKKRIGSRPHTNQSIVKFQMIVAQARNWQLKSSAHSRRGSTVFSRSLESYSGCFPDPWHRNSGEKLFIEHCQGFSGQSPEIRRLLCPRPPPSSSATVFLWLPGGQHTSWRAAHTAQLHAFLLRYLFTGLEQLIWGQTAVMAAGPSK